MAKAKIDLNPQGPITFEREVAIPTPSGKPMKLKMTFKHRTRQEMAEMTERYVAKARAQYVEMQEEMKAEKAAQEAAEARGDIYLPPEQKLAEGVPDAIQADVDAVLDIATGWELADEFNAENLAKLFGLYNRSAKAIAEDYRVSMNEGRLGN